MDIKKYTFEELRGEYLKIYTQVFREFDSNHIPGSIYLGFRDDVYMGFMAGYFHDKVTFYIQKIGISPELKGKHLAQGILEEVMQYLKTEEKVIFLFAQIETINIPAIITVLHTGWLVNGYFTDTAGVAYVRVIRDLKEG